MEARPHDAEAGRRRFHFRRCLGRGGFGEVYQATMQSPGGVQTAVAVKLLHADLSPDSQGVQRLRDEGRLLGHLDHPSILRVIDLVVLEHRLALVTEYVDGCDLDECWKTASPIPERPLVEAMGMVADALATAWRATTADGVPLELVHRDIKPSNIRIGRHGTVKLLDFGIARAHDGHREARTSTSQVMGSFLFLAPERLDLETESTVGPPSDVFALGVTLFEGLHHEALFAGMTEKRQYLLSLDRGQFDAHVAERLRVLDDRAPELRALVRSMLQHDPALRPTAAEVAASCERLVDALPGPPLRRWCRDFAWPAAPEGRGPLVDEVITEAGSGSHPLPPSRRADGASDTSSLVVTRPEGSWRSRTLVGIAGLGVLWGAGALVLFVFAVGVAAAWWANRPAAPDLSPGGPVVDAPTPPARLPAPPDPAPAAPDPVPEPAAPEPVAADPAASPPAAPAAPLPRPAPADPRPAPPPRPREAPAPVPTPASAASWSVEGPQAVELRAGGRSARPGAVDPGTWEIWTDFGKGDARAGTVTIRPGARVVIRCNRIRLSCAAAD